MKEVAIILDVRTKGEFGFGHIRGSVNIPVEQLQ
ncbi:MAG: rhodanese-like domain-containing protein, partial [Bacteroidota bacterium]|nr:rhodanese-like domain-containing protein [Bacteroidota bacterium]